MQNRFGERDALQHVGEEDWTFGCAVAATFQSGNDDVFDFGSRNSGQRPRRTLPSAQ
jgi:hypothetical protein